jgi:hypothetical protein
VFLRVSLLLSTLMRTADVVASRAYYPTLPIFKPAGELVWLQQPPMPDGGAFNSTWEERVLITPHGPDVEFVLHDFDGDNTTEVRTFVRTARFAIVVDAKLRLVV